MLLLLQMACKRIDNKLSVISCFICCVTYNTIRCLLIWSAQVFFCFDALYQYILVSIAQSLLFLGLFLFLLPAFLMESPITPDPCSDSISVLECVYLSHETDQQMDPGSQSCPWSEDNVYIICEPCLAVIKSVIKRTQEKLDRATCLNWFLLFL